MENTTSNNEATLQQTEPPKGEDSVHEPVRRLLTWIAINVALVWCAWAGVHGNEGAGRVLAFVTWFFAALYWMALMVPKEVTEPLRKKGRSVPAWLSHGYDAGMIIFLVWHGWWWTAIALTIMTIAEAGIFSKPNVQDDLPLPAGGAGVSKEGVK